MPRESARKRGYTTRWDKARRAFLAAHPLCVECRAQGRVVSASVVDHIVPHRGDYGLMWDEANWQPLCKTHHDRKTASEDGGFGNQTLVKGCGVDGMPTNPQHPWGVSNL